MTTDKRSEEILAARMLKIWTLRKQHDDAYDQWRAFAAEYGEAWMFPHPRNAEYRQKVDPLLESMKRLEKAIEELERLSIPIDSLDNPGIRPEGKNV